jgi:zinc protease
MSRLPKVSALLALLALAAPLVAALPFPQAGSDLRADPAATFGTLPNGLRYVVLPNHEPKARASLRLLVLAGSFEETEAQRGLAHFLEHMAFNGSTHFAPGTLVERLQRLGMGFGADTNAATSFDHTFYQLELPDTKPDTLSEGLEILADYCGGLLLQQAMVDKERGIILSEKRTRDSVPYRTLVAELEFMEAGTRVPERLPIGLADVIEKSGRGPFVDFYNTWYRPELMAVVVVGDIDAASIERQIVAKFSPVEARSPEPQPADLGRVREFTGTRALFHSEPEAPDTQVVIASTVPYTRPQDTAAERLRMLPRNLAVEMLNRRLAILAKKENAPFIRAAAQVDEPFNLYREAEISVVSKAEQWQAGLGVAEQELRRALEFGFRPDELREAAADLRNDLEQAAKTASTRRSDEIAGEIVSSIVDREVFTSPADDLALLGPALSRVTAADCVGALRDAWSAPDRYVFASGNAKVAGDADAAVRAAYEGSQRVSVKPPEAVGSVAWGYTDFGPAGSVASRTHIDDLDITEVTLSNGVRLNLKKTPFEANTIHVSARLGTGQLQEPAAKQPGLSTFTNLTYGAGGLGKHSADDLQRILSGKTVGVQLTSTTDAFLISGDTNRTDLSLELQLLTATLTDPGYRPEALREARKRIEAAYISFAHTERGPLALKIPRILASGDPRFGLPPQEELMKRSLDEERAWLSPTLASAALEVSVAGDFDPEDVIDAAARTLGTLPRREPRPALDDLRRVSYPREPFRKDFAIESDIPKSLAAVYWPGGDGMDVHRARRLNMLASVLNDRLRVKVREQLGSTYSPTVGCTASDIFPGYGYFAAIVIVEPAKAKQIQDVVVGVAADICTNGVTPDELDRAKNPIMTSIRESERTNAYWMTVLSRAQERPEVLDWARSRRFDFESITKADLDALAAAWLAPEKASRVIIHPYPAPAGAPAAVTPPPDGL